MILKFQKIETRKKKKKTEIEQMSNVESGLWSIRGVNIIIIFNYLNLFFHLAREQ